jgi:hypothetical protein
VLWVAYATHSTLKPVPTTMKAWEFCMMSYLFHQLASIIRLNYENLLKSKDRAKDVGININVEKRQSQWHKQEKEEVVKYWQTMITPLRS